MTLKTTRKLWPFVATVLRYPSRTLSAWEIKDDANVMDDVVIWFWFLISMAFCGWKGLLLAMLFVAATYLPPQKIRLP